MLKVTLSILGPILFGALVFSSSQSFAQNVLDPNPQVPIVPKTLDDAFQSKYPNLGRWKILQTQWTPDIENEWRAFVQAFGHSNCQTVDDCMKDPTANIYLDPLETETFFYADCGRFPYLLRMYFSWKKGLPFSAVVKKTGTPEEVQAWVDKQVLAGFTNIRPNRDFPTNNSENGNIMTARFTIPSIDERSNDFFTAAEYVISRVNSANYRFDSERPMPEQADFYPIDINPQALVPGTVLYDPAGHIVTVYEVTPQGDIKFIDSHPDNSIQRVVFNKTFKRSRPAHGAGFKNFRPFNWDGSTLTMMTNDQIPGYSTVQFYGNVPSPAGWLEGKFQLAGLDLEYFDFVRFKVATQSVQINPAEQFSKELGEMCLSMQERSKDVLKPFEVGLIDKEHPAQLPRNIYNASDDWEAFSTPGRDSRLKMSVTEIIKSAQSGIQKVQQHHPYFTYTGDNFYADLIKRAQVVNQKCKLSYTNSQGQVVRLDFLAAVTRLKKFSFDPYHCPERRWGASGAELATCTETPDKAAWYDAEQIYRDQIDRIQGDQMDDDLLSLQAKNNAHKPATWSSDVIALLQKLQTQ